MFKSILHDENTTQPILFLPYYKHQKLSYKYMAHVMTPCERQDLVSNRSYLWIRAWWWPHCKAETGRSHGFITYSCCVWRIIKILYYSSMDRRHHVSWNISSYRFINSLLLPKLPLEVRPSKLACWAPLVCILNLHWGFVYTNECRNAWRIVNGIKRWSDSF